KSGTRMKEDDGVEHFFTCCDHDSLLFFSDRGVAYCLKAYQVPTGSRTSRGMPIVQLLPIPRDEKITSIVPVTEFSRDEYLVMMTTGGYIKKTELAAFSNIRANGLIAITLEAGDQLRWVRRAHNGDSIIIGSRQGMAIHFKIDQERLRSSGRTARGVKAMALRAGDHLIGMDILPAATIAELVDEPGEEEPVEPLTPLPQGPCVLVITTGGYGKRVPFSQFRLQNRAGMGLVAIKFRHAQDQVASLQVVHQEDELMIITSRGIIIRQAVNAISPQSRMATGVRVQRLDEEDSIVAVALVPPSSEADLLENGEN
ncbi:MAG TPA: DNA gyrase C-terminal beta-propeller domain-containing protein, partial [Candidatus Caenarcaniphilales bacterium]